MTDKRPHSRACGVSKHEHGADCHPNCPTCKGRPTDLTEAQANTVAAMDAGYQERIKTQSDRIGVFVSYLQDRGLLDDFNEWEAGQHGRD